mgnify:CR=1 FL=1
MNNQSLIDLAASKGLTLHPSLLAEYPIGTLFYCLHHDNKIPVEELTEPLINRVRFVLENKPQHELAVRLAAMRPVLDNAKRATLDADYEAKRATLYADYEADAVAQWDEEYPDHPKWTVATGLEF